MTYLTKLNNLFILRYQKNILMCYKSWMLLSNSKHRFQQVSLRRCSCGIPITCSHSYQCHLVVRPRWRSTSTASHSSFQVKLSGRRPQLIFNTFITKLQSTKNPRIQEDKKVSVFHTPDYSPTCENKSNNDDASHLTAFPKLFAMKSMSTS